MKGRNSCFHHLAIIVAMLPAIAWFGASFADDAGRIQPYDENPAYWQYNNKPVLLLGGSSDDNLFQHTSPDLDDELDRLAKNGGNYVRCTMSSRDSGNVYPFFQDAVTQKYDLDRWNDEYWRRFNHFLKATLERNIIVQIEVWATYDFYSRSSHFVDGKSAWERNPYNPRNNINYDKWQTGLSELFESHGQSLINPFFNTTLPLAEPFDFTVQPVLLGHQQKFVDKLLSISLQYDHVLYCMDNETQADPQWSIYWAQYIRKKAAEQNLAVETTEMFDPFDPTGGAVEGVQTQNPFTHFFMSRSNVHVALTRPEIFTFIEIANHNAQVGQVHFETAYHIWKKIQESGIIRPLNNVKIYGAGDGGWNGSSKDGQERFWRNVFAGAASVRFHRPPSGLGHTDLAMSHIKSMRLLTDSIDLFSCRPANDMLSDREENEAYCLANPCGEYILFFPAGGDIRLNIESGKYAVRWLDVRASTWRKPQKLTFPGVVKTPDDGFWAVRIAKSN